jgi:hypothetical protein
VQAAGGSGHPEVSERTLLCVGALRLLAVETASPQLPACEPTCPRCHPAAVAEIVAGAVGGAVEDEIVAGAVGGAVEDEIVAGAVGGAVIEYAREPVAALVVRNAMLEGMVARAEASARSEE